MDGFIALVIDLVKANGLANAEIHQRRTVLTLPGYYVSASFRNSFIRQRQSLLRRERQWLAAPIATSPT